jgi:hypothetical protein
MTDPRIPSNDGAYEFRQTLLIGDGWGQAVEGALDGIEAEAREMAASAEHLELVRAI